MMVSQIGKALVLFAMLFVLVSSQESFADGLRGGFDGAFGSQFHPQTRSVPPDVKHRPHHAPSATR